MRDDLVGVPLLGQSFTGHLPMLEEITTENLQYDVRDAQQVSPHQLVSKPVSWSRRLTSCWVEPKV